MNYSQRTDLILPEYGRNIQQMVKHAVAIEDRAERTRCAKTIIDIMGNMFPYLRDVEGFKYKLWDHLAIMSEFKLDIDYPFEVVKPTTLQQKPEKIPYNTQRIRYMHYGRLLQTLIEKTVAYPEGERRQELIDLMANHMKKSYLTWNKEVVDDRKIFDDLRELSHGELDMNPESMTLTASRDIMNRNRPANKNNNNKARNKNNNNNNRNKK
ncbi:MAG: DUF4290 domain-containing protein [Prevotellaceae bacterium]|jgi:hypothetical protein|nr:DUF4290 domain-containing protein [Prevotellaceae bacterium]MDD3479735.1 DUF4290 domain-containing protein [Paludibacteraceae bacterium]